MSYAGGGSSVFWFEIAEYGGGSSGGVGMGVFGGKYSRSESTGGLFDPGLGLCDLLSVLLADLWPRTVYTWSRGLPRGLGGPDPSIANPWSLMARARDLRHLKMRRMRNIVAIQRNNEKPTLQDARRKTPDTAAPRMSLHLAC